MRSGFFSVPSEVFSSDHQIPPDFGTGPVKSILFEQSRVELEEFEIPLEPILERVMFLPSSSVRPRRSSMIFSVKHLR